MKRLWSATVITMSAIVVVGCTHVTATADFDPEASFTDYEVYQWMRRPPQENTGVESVYRRRVQNRIRANTDSILAVKGYREVATDPDFWVVYLVGAEGKLDIQSSPMYGSYGMVWGGEVGTTEYTEGTVIIDVVDAQSNQLVWRGRAIAKIYEEQLRPDEVDALVLEAVRQILERFPPDQD